MPFVRGDLRGAVWIAIGLMTAAIGCGGDHARPSVAAVPPATDAATPEAASLLPAPDPGRGEQFTMTTEIPAGDERESCMFVRTREPLIVNRDEIRFTTGSHHVLLFLTKYADVPTERLDGMAVDTSGVFDCSDGVQGLWSVTGLVGMSQNATGQSAISFPEGVGLRVAANSLLMINAHYINATDDTLTPEIAINLHSIPEDELQQEGDLLFWYDPFLKVPANGHSIMTASCPLPTNIQITNVQSHMHRRGIDYHATLITPDGDRNPIYDSHNWQDVDVMEFSPNLQVQAGSRLEWSCEYMNSEDHDIYQGPRTTDEMCMLIGSYYPLDDTTGFCSRNGQAFLGAEWSIGQGDASCATSLLCLQQAASDNDGGPTTGSAGKSITTKITDCMLAAKSSIAAPLSAAVGCLMSAGKDAVSKCSAEISACTMSE